MRNVVSSDHGFGLFQLGSSRTANEVPVTKDIHVEFSFPPGAVHGCRTRLEYPKQGQLRRQVFGSGNRVPAARTIHWRARAGPTLVLRVGTVEDVPVAIGLDLDQVIGLKPGHLRGDLVSANGTPYAPPPA